MRLQFLNSAVIANSKLDYTWFAVTWWDGHVGGPNNSKLWLVFCIIIESNSRKTFSLLFCHTNMAAMTSSENHLLLILRQNDTNVHVWDSLPYPTEFLPLLPEFVRAYVGIITKSSGIDRFPFSFRNGPPLCERSSLNSSVGFSYIKSHV